MRTDSQLPLPQLNADEIEALLVGTRFVRAYVGAQQAESATAAPLKIGAELPPALRASSRRCGAISRVRILPR